MSECVYEASTYFGDRRYETSCGYVVKKPEQGETNCKHCGKEIFIEFLHEDDSNE